MKISNLYSVLKCAVWALVLVGSVGCTKNFEDYNKLDDEPGFEQIPSPIRTGLAIQSMTFSVIPLIKNQYQISENMLGGAYGRYFAYAQANKWTDTFLYYNVREEWHNAVFSNTMTNVYANWSKVREITNGEGLSYAWAQIVRIAAVHRLTDIFGPMPYSKMGQGTGIVTEYDSQELVYHSMLEDLDNAIAEISSLVAVNPADRSMKAYDYIYEGDFEKWLKFANSLKLRLAMRLTYVEPELAKQKAEEAVANPFGLINNNKDNAAIAVMQTGDKNPLRWLVQDYSDCTSAAEIVTYMKSFNDPRISMYFNYTPSKEDFVGQRVGAPSSSYWSRYYSLPIVKTEDRVMWMNAAEVAFLRAEMAMRNWDAGDTAENLYKQGIHLSFEQWGADMSLYDAYVADNSSKPMNYIAHSSYYNYNAKSQMTVAWDEAASDEAKLEKIITQKWIAIYPLGTEAWTEQRRTGYPYFYPTLTNKSSEPSLNEHGAYRIPFPPSEALRNPEHYAKAVELLNGPDQYSTRLWWDAKQNKPQW